jgi:hypothetical protein
LRILQGSKREQPRSLLGCGTTKSCLTCSAWSATWCKGFLVHDSRSVYRSNGLKLTEKRGCLFAPRQRTQVHLANAAVELNAELLLSPLRSGVARVFTCVRREAAAGRAGVRVTPCHAVETSHSHTHNLSTTLLASPSQREPFTRDPTPALDNHVLWVGTACCARSQRRGLPCSCVRARERSAFAGTLQGCRRRSRVSSSHVNCWTLFGVLANALHNHQTAAPRHVQLTEPKHTNRRISATLSSWQSSQDGGKCKWPACGRCCLFASIVQLKGVSS